MTRRTYVAKQWKCLPTATEEACAQCGDPAEKGKDYCYHCLDQHVKEVKS